MGEVKQRILTFFEYQICFKMCRTFFPGLPAWAVTGDCGRRPLDAHLPGLRPRTAQSTRCGEASLCCGPRLTPLRSVRSAKVILHRQASCQHFVNTTFRSEQTGQKRSPNLSFYTKQIFGEIQEIWGGNLTNFRLKRIFLKLKVFLLPPLRHTTLQSVMNAQLSKHRFWHCHENRLIKTIQTIPHNLCVSFKSASLYSQMGFM